VAERDWFGFRTVTRARPGRDQVYHGFRRDRPGERSLCGRATFGPRINAKGRCCDPCADIWHRRYPKVDR
jgi:hypothetical protein